MFITAVFSVSPQLLTRRLFQHPYKASCASGSHLRKEQSFKVFEISGSVIYMKRIPGENMFLEKGKGTKE